MNAAVEVTAPARGRAPKFAKIPALVPPVPSHPVIKGDFENGLWMGKWDIWDPRDVAYVERTPFLKSLCGHIDHEDTLENVILSNKKAGVTAKELRDLAATYTKLSNKGARLPKFSRWVLGMWVGHPEYSKMLAEEGQRAAGRKIVMSVDVVDILRCAATPHFASCFDRSGTFYAGERPTEIARHPDGSVDEKKYHSMPVKIAEECPGIGIVYVEDEKGMIMGRQWMHHAKVKETGEDIIVLTTGHYGCVEPNNVARLLHNKFGVRVASSAAGKYRPDDFRTPIEFVGCFDKALHHDLDTWSADQYAKFLAPVID